MTNIVGRDERGRFAVGNRGGGRPKEEWKKELTSALRHRFSGERVADIAEDALDLAIKQKSPRGIVAVLEFVRDTVDGRPAVRVEKEEGGVIEEAMLRWMEMKQQVITVVEPSRE